MKTKITISSHINFYKKTYPILVDSLLNAGVPSEDIYFFIGGCDSYEKVDGDVNVWKVDHNSIDFTGLISVLDLDIKSDRWFLLHDTVYVGKNFYKCIQDKKSEHDTIDMSLLWPKNMGSYSQDYLLQIKSILLNEYKNKDNSINAAQKFKTFNVDTENQFLKNKDFYTTDIPTIILNNVDFYDSNNMRSVQYYKNIDIYKVQACNNFPGNYNIKL